jgi:hypothetical protein
VATTVSVDLEIDKPDTVPALEFSADDGVYSLSLGNSQIEVRLIASEKTLNELIDNCRAALDSLEFTRTARRLAAS